jgi:putative zinc finger/helix-turn-helix YgiT family protein
MNTSEQLPCSACENGHYEEVLVPYRTMTADEVQVLIPQVKVLRCSACADELLPPETQKQIDEAIAEATEQLSPRDLEAIWEKFGLDQTETAEVLGLGSKTFHRWLNGNQYPSRSMGYYLRVLAEFPETFEWLRGRGWRRRNRVAQYQKIDFAIQFPELAQTASESQWRNPDPVSHVSRLRFNPTSLFRKTRV